MIVDKSLILKELKLYKNFKTDAEFAKFLGIAPNTLANWYKRNTFDEHVIVNLFPELTKSWLLTGEGDMLKSGHATAASNSESDKLIPLLPTAAQGGSLSDFIMSVNGRDCELVVSPIADVDFAMPIAGDSMAPEYPAGSQILVKKINEKAFIDWGRVYVLDTCNGAVIKILIPSEKDGHVKCQSINPDPKYAPFEVAYSDIFGIYRVLLCMAIK